VGKAASSRNALKFGIHARSLVIPGEDPEELENLAGKLFESLARRQQALQRDYYRALKEIRESRQARSEAAMFAAMARQSAQAPRPVAAQAENRLRFSNPASAPPPVQRLPPMAALQEML